MLQSFKPSGIRRTSKNFDSNGDSEAARRLNLHMYFRSEPLRLQFEEAARREGFAIGSAVDREMSELPYGVILHIIVR